MSLPPPKVINAQTSLQNTHYKISRDAITDQSSISLEHKKSDVDVGNFQWISQQHGWLDIVHLPVADTTIPMDT